MNIEKTREALQKLRNEVEHLKAFEPEIRAIIGNTNWTCLFARVAIADSVLGAAPQNAAEHVVDCSCADCIDIRAMRSVHSQMKWADRICEECGGQNGGFHFFGCSNAARTKDGI